MYFKNFLSTLSYSNTLYLPANFMYAHNIAVLFMFCLCNHKKSRITIVQEQHDVGTNKNKATIFSFQKKVSSTLFPSWRESLPSFYNIHFFFAVFVFVASSPIPLNSLPPFCCLTARCPVLALPALASNHQSSHYSLTYSLAHHTMLANAVIA